jgi:hypothetical protein
MPKLIVVKFGLPRGIGDIINYTNLGANHSRDVYLATDQNANTPYLYLGAVALRGALSHQYKILWETCIARTILLAKRSNLIMTILLVLI